MGEIKDPDRDKGESETLEQAEFSRQLKEMAESLDGQKRNKTTKEVIEDSPNPNLEHAFVKHPLTEAEDITDYQRSSEINVRFNPGRVMDYEERYQQQHPDAPRPPLSYIHTHPSELPKFSLLKRFVYWIRYGVGKEELQRKQDIAALHSGGDFKSFLYAGPEFAPIALRNPKTGELLGYNVLKKTKKTPGIVDYDKGIDNGDELERDFDHYDAERLRAMKKNDPSIARQAYDAMLEKYHLRSRFVSAEDYEANKEGTSFVKKQK